MIFDRLTVTRPILKQPDEGYRSKERGSPEDVVLAEKQREVQG